MPNTLQETKSIKNRLIISSKQNDLKSEFSSITNIPGFVIAKDIHSRYSVISKDYALLLGWKSPDQCIDLTDFDHCLAMTRRMFLVRLQRTILFYGLFYSSYLKYMIQTGSRNF